MVSAFVEPEDNPPWYARISFYGDTFAPTVHLPAQTSIDGICDAVRAWLESVIEEAATTHDGSVTAS